MAKRFGKYPLGCCGNNQAHIFSLILGCCGNNQALISTIIIIQLFDYKVYQTYTHVQYYLLRIALF